MRLQLAGAVGLVLLRAVAAAQEPAPLGGQFQVNSYTTNWQVYPSVAVDADGDFAVVWMSFGSYGPDSSGESVQGQRYDGTGNPVGGQFQVNSHSTSYQGWPSLGLDTDGDFVVVWHSWAQDGSDFGIFGQRFAAGGTPQGGEFPVNSYTISGQSLASVGIDADGDFVVVWRSNGSYGTDSDSFSVQAQRFGASGLPIGGQFQINTYTSSAQHWASVALDPDGDFVVVWQSNGSYGTDTSLSSVQGQRYDAAGNAIGGEFQVNTYSTSYQSVPSVAVEANGDFVVVWTSDGSYGTDTSSTSVQGQRYDASGEPIGDEFQVNSYTPFDQHTASVASDPDGNFVVVWTSDGSYGTDTSLTSVQGQLYDAAGNPVGGQFQINTYTSSAQYRASVAIDPDGHFVVVWTSDGSYDTDTDYVSIQGQRFASPAIFADGFESGDTSAWSGSVP